ncbi:MAG: DUF3795 domain-containing protein [Candidatus Aenigmarchaeota archaeon]|nr:DUF3795 domain-containing protein [Candidatus Aenigmarchaeota archaeon]
MKAKFDKNLVAPCGINCAYCLAYLNYSKSPDKNDVFKFKGKYCSGCIPRDKHCGFLKQRCFNLKNKKVRFCYECAKFPCENLQKLDKRYEKKGWNNSFSGNNKRIKEVGIERFIEEQNKKFRCPKCSGPIYIQGGKCYDCGFKAGNP